MIIKKKTISTILLLLAFIVISCTNVQSNSIGDGGLISGEPCEAPCFYNIVPDSTNEDELRNIIRETKVLNPCKKYDFTNSGGNSGYSCANSNLLIEKGLVTGLEFFPSSKIKLEDVFTKYGEPEKFVLKEENLPEYPMQLNMRLIYSSLCMEIFTEAKDGTTYVIDYQTLVTQVTYLGKTLCKESNEDVYRNADDWSGLGSYPNRLP